MKLSTKRQQTDKNSQAQKEKQDNIIKQRIENKETG